MSKCPNSLFGKHKYQGRYDESFPLGTRMGGLQTEGYAAWELVDVINSYKTRTYVCDVCQHCGDKIER